MSMEFASATKQPPPEEYKNNIDREIELVTLKKIKARERAKAKKAALLIQSETMME